MEALIVMKVGNGYLIVPTKTPESLDLTHAKVASCIRNDYSRTSVCEIAEDHFVKTEAA